MRANTARKYILLEQSGELSERRRLRLETHLESHPEDRAYRDDLLALTAVIRENPEAETPEPSLSRILAEARTPAPETTLGTGVYLRPALALAALAAVCLGAWVYLHEGDATRLAQSNEPTTPAASWDDGLDEELDELNSMLASLDNGNIGSDTALDEWATELLELEGSAI